MTFTTKTLIAATAALMIAGGAGMAQAAQVTTAETDTTVYSAAGTNNEAIGALSDGDYVTVNSCFGNWCKVTFNGGVGYTYQSALDLEGYNASPATYEPSDS